MPFSEARTFGETVESLLSLFEISWLVSFLEFEWGEVVTKILMVIVFVTFFPGLACSDVRSPVAS